MSTRYMARSLSTTRRALATVGAGQQRLPASPPVPASRACASLGVGVGIGEEPSAGLVLGRGYRILYPSITDPGGLTAARFGTAALAAAPLRQFPRRPRRDRLGLVRRGGQASSSSR